MTTVKSGSLFVILLVIVIPLVLFLFVPNLLLVKKFDQKISDYRSLSSLNSRTSLPVNERKKFGDDNLIAYGEVSINSPMTATEDRYLLIPFYSGHLSIALNDSIFFDSGPEDKKFKVMRVDHLFIKLPPMEYAKENVLKFRISYGQEIFGSLSEFYIGSKEDLGGIDRRILFYYDDIKSIFWGAELLFCIVLITLWGTKALGEEAFPPLIISIFILLINNSSYTAVLPYLADLQPYFLASAPVCLFAISEFRRYLSAGSPFYISKRGLIGYSAFAVSILMAKLLLDQNIQNLNTFVTVPFLIIGLFLQLVISTTDFLKNRNLYIGFFAVGLLTFLFTLAHDLLTRIGYFDNVILLTTPAIPLLFFTIGAAFSGKIARDQKALAQSNEYLNRMLEQNTKKLNEEFALVSKLNAEKASADQTRKLHFELHDGVLTYLSIINAITEQSTDETLKSVNTLARNASTEIRVIVEAETIKRVSLFSALSTFRQTVADPLVFLNVAVDWNMLSLKQHDLTDAVLIMGVVRIFQEAIHNAVERANCTELKVSAELQEDGRLQLTVINQGGSALSNSDKRGMGIRSMQDRANSLGIELSLSSLPSGAILNLILPRNEPVSLKGG